MTDRDPELRDAHVAAGDPASGAGDQPAGRQRIRRGPLTYRHDARPGRGQPTTWWNPRRAADGRPGA